MALNTLEISRDKKGNIDLAASDYNPGGKEKDTISRILSCYKISDEIRNKTYREFNDYTLLQRQSIDQRTFNAWQEQKSEDPDEEWRSNAVRPIARNRIISIAAHITGALINPTVTAQNDNDEEDKDAAKVMKDLMDWRNKQAKYDRTFLYSVISALVNPAVILHTEFCKVEKEIKDLKTDGNWEKKKVLDEIMSGFKDNIVPVDELFIGNIYEHDIQKQPWLIWRRFIDYNDASLKYYNKFSKFQYVRPGIQAVFNHDDNTFYEQYDEELEGRLVEELHFYDRTNDLHLIMVNGVLITDTERPLQRIDKKYPFVKTGYELIDEGKFFYYRSLANKLKPDEEVVNTLYRMTIDGTFLQLMPPVAVFGEDEIGASVVRPGTVTPFDRESKIEKIDVGNNVNQGLQTLEKTERSISESSADTMQAGMVPESGTRTARETNIIEQNAKIMLGMFHKMIGFMVQDLGDLIISDIIQFMTVAEAMDITDSRNKVKFRKFLVEKGEKTRKIEFDTEMSENPTMQEVQEESLGIMEEEDKGFDPKQEIYRVNPGIFRKRKFNIEVSADFRTPPTENMKRALNIEAYDRAVQHPLADQEAIYKDLLLGSYDSTKDDPDKYVKKPERSSGGGLESIMQGGGSGQEASLASLTGSNERANAQDQ
jgi:hypothetical protein